MAQWLTATLILKFRLLKNRQAKLVWQIIQLEKALPQIEVVKVLLFQWIPLLMIIRNLNLKQTLKVVFKVHIILIPRSGGFLVCKNHSHTVCLTASSLISERMNQKDQNSKIRSRNINYKMTILTRMINSLVEEQPPAKIKLKEAKFKQSKVLEI